MDTIESLFSAHKDAHKEAHREAYVGVLNELIVTTHAISHVLETTANFIDSPSFDFANARNVFDIFICKYGWRLSPRRHNIFVEFTSALEMSNAKLNYVPSYAGY